MPNLDHAAREGMLVITARLAAHPDWMAAAGERIAEAGDATVRDSLAAEGTQRLVAQSALFAA